jgi:curli biogenesis system outer membrane secretion channel CsgG
VKIIILTKKIILLKLDKNGGIMKKFYLIVFFVLIGCASSKSVVQPSNISFSSSFDIFKPYRVAVLPVSSDLQNMSDEIRNSLSEFVSFELSKINGFTLVEREKIDKVLSEQALGLTGAVDIETAAKVGKLLGADAVLLSQVVELKRDEFFEEDEAYDGKIFIRLVDTSTGEILFYSKGVGKSLEGKIPTLEESIKNALEPLRRKREMK